MGLTKTGAIDPIYYRARLSALKQWRFAKRYGVQ